MQLYSVIGEPPQDPWYMEVKTRYLQVLCWKETESPAFLSLSQAQYDSWINLAY